MNMTTRVASIVSSSVVLLGSYAFTVDAGQTSAVLITFSGRVVAADSGEALVNARVTLTGPNDFHAVTLSRIDGGFTFASVAVGVYRLAAAKPGYVRTEFGARGFGLAGALRVDGGSLGDLQIRVPRGAAVSGRVLDPRGDPAIGHTVAAAWGGDDNGRGAMAIAATRTDDLGEYRLGGLPAGTVRIFLGGLPPAALSPNAPSSRATDPQVVTLATAEERSGVDFALPRSLLLNFDNAAAQQSGAGVAIRGRVVSQDGRPLAGAQVMLLRANDVPVTQVDVSDVIDPSNTRVRPLRMASSDDTGQYVLAGIPPGRYRVGARRYGYLPLAFDQPRSSESGRVFAIGAADGLNGVDIMLPRLDAIAGRITDEVGNPIEGAIVTVVATRFEDGRRVLVQPPGVGLRPSDDRGQYRVFGVEPGRYLVRAGAGDPYGLRFGVATGSEIPGYTSSFFPGTLAAADATQVDVGPASEVTGVDFPLLRTAMATVSGRVVTLNGQPFRGRLEIAPRLAGELTANDSCGAIIYPDGRFEFRNVAPGEYVVSSYRGRSASTEGEFGAVVVSVNAGNVSGVSLITSAGSTIRGRVLFDGAPAPPAGDVAISTMPTDPDLSPKGGDLATASLDADGAFALRGITGTRRLRVIKAPRGWALESMTLNGVNITDRPLKFGTVAQSIDMVDVLLTNRLTEISGEVTAAKGLRVSSAAVVAFAADQERWYPVSRFVQYTTAPDGTFTIRGLPGGDYFLAAVPRTKALDAGAWQERATLEALALRAVRVSLGDEQRLAQNLQISSR
jgi:protocatechuate 3,4-dioxygenase beta subunit